MEDYFYQKMYSDLIKPSPSQDAEWVSVASVGLATGTNNSNNNNSKSNNKKKSEKKKKTKYKSYHTLLLEKSIEESYRSRGKMQKYVDYNAFNSDDDSDDAESNNDLMRSGGLFQRYGLESRMWNEIAVCARNKTDELPKWSKHAIKKKEATTTNTNSNNKKQQKQKNDG